MSVITFIRKAKQPDNLLLDVKGFDDSIKTRSMPTALFLLFKNHHAGINKKRLVELLKYINAQFAKLPPVSSVEGAMSKIRSVLKTTYGYDSVQYKNSLKFLVFDKEQKSKNIAAYNAKVFERNTHCEPIKISLINTLLENRDAVGYKEQIIYLLLNSGSRFIELFTGNFRLDPDNPTHILLSNIAKTRNKDRIISKPLLDKDPKHFLSVLNDIREYNPKTTKIMVNKMLQDKLGKTTYFLRKVYANMSYHILNNPRIAKTTYLAGILGHELFNETTALSYQGFYIEEDKPFKYSRL